MSLKGSLRGDDVFDMAPDLRFDTDDPEFQRGFEIGVLWERLVTDGACNMAVSASNAEMVIRVAQAFGCQFSGREIEDDQISVELYQMHGQ